MKQYVSKWKASQKEVEEVCTLSVCKDVKVFTCDVCEEEFQEQEEFDKHQEPVEIIQSMFGKEFEVYIQCKDCEYSTDNFYVFGKHTYRNHRDTVSKDNKETVVAMISVSVQTELMKRKDF